MHDVFTSSFCVSAGGWIAPGFLDTEEVRGSNPLAPTKNLLDLRNHPVAGKMIAL
jgi:hypothetical protein